MESSPGVIFCRGKYRLLRGRVPHGDGHFHRHTAFFIDVHHAVRDFHADFRGQYGDVSGVRPCRSAAGGADGAGGEFDGCVVRVSVTSFFYCFPLCQLHTHHASERLVACTVTAPGGVPGGTQILSVPVVVLKF